MKLDVKCNQSDYGLYNISLRSKYEKANDKAKNYGFCATHEALCSSLDKSKVLMINSTLNIEINNQTMNATLINSDTTNIDYNSTSFQYCKIDASEWEY